MTARTVRTLLLAAPLALAAGGVLAAECEKTGGILTYTFSPEPSGLSTIVTTAVPVAIISTKIYESLLTYEGAGMTPQPGLAESWEVSPDFLTYTFHLRPGVKWHDGSDFTAADVKFSIEQIDRPFHSRGKANFGKVTAIDTPDPLTVVFTLEEPVPFFLKVFQPAESPIFAQHAFEGVDMTDAASVRGAPAMQNPVGTGPFRFKDWQKGSHIALERNPDYWNPGHPCLDGIIARVIPDGAARAIALETGEVDLVPMNGMPEAEIVRLSSDPELVANADGSEALGPLMWFELNNREKPLADMKVRQALSLAIDREKVVDVVFYGLGTPARGPLVSGNPHFDQSLPLYEYDPAKAEAMLDEAGYPRDASGIRFKLRQNYLPYGESYVRLAEYLKQEFSKLGVELDTRSVDLGGWLKTVYTDWDYDITSNFAHNYTDPLIGTERTFASSYIRQGATFTNSMDYRNPQVDALFDAMRVETDEAARAAQINELQQILHEEQPVWFLMEMHYTNLWNQRVHGLITNGVSMYSSWDSVWKD